MKQIKSQDIALLVLRVVTGLVIAYFGSQKVFGIFGGMGFQGTVNAFKAGQGFPMPIAVCAMAGEFLGGLGMVFGVLTRFAAFGVFATMCVATYVSASQHGVMQGIANGTPPDSMSKVAFPLIIAAASFAVMLVGGGSLSLDSRLFRKKGGK